MVDGEPRFSAAHVYQLISKSRRTLRESRLPRSGHVEASDVHARMVRQHSMEDVHVVRDDGTSGRVLADANSCRIVVEFDDGEAVVVPSTALVAQADGTRRLAAGVSPATAVEREVIIPLIAEELTVEKERVARERRPANRAVSVNPDLFKERSFEMVEIDEIAKVGKSARVVDCTSAMTSPRVSHSAAVHGPPWKRIHVGSGRRRTPERGRRTRPP
jgi:hypothetical protein